jgi:hypothetical protein
MAGRGFSSLGPCRFYTIWTLWFGPCFGLILLPVILYPRWACKCDERDGWFVHPKDTEVAGLAKTLSAVQASMQDHIMREYTCMAPKSELWAMMKVDYQVASWYCWNSCFKMRIANICCGSQRKCMLTVWNVNFNKNALVKLHGRQFEPNMQCGGSLGGSHTHLPHTNIPVISTKSGWLQPAGAVLNPCGSWSSQADPKNFWLELVWGVLSEAVSSLASEGCIKESQETQKDLMTRRFLTVGL